MVDPIVTSIRLTRVLVDGGSGLNILYARTLDDMQIPCSLIKPGAAPFHGIVPGKDAQPLGPHHSRCNLFRTPDNFCKENLTFAVVGFRSSYHAILRWTFFAKFMSLSNYVYLQLKILGPNGVITVWVAVCTLHSVTTNTSSSPSRSVTR